MIITIVLFVMLFIIDQLTKYLAQIFIAQGTTVSFVPYVMSFTKTYNEGSGFSFLADSDYNWLLVVISLIATVVLCYYCYKNDWKREKYKSVLLTMILAGCGEISSITATSSFSTCCPS